MNLKGIEHEFVKARTAVFMASATERQKIAGLHRIEDEFCRRLAHKPRLKLEVKRRIAETLLDMSISRGQTLSTCRARFNALGKLGYTDTEQKAHYFLMYARAAVERGHPRISANLSHAMILELRRSLRRRPQTYWRVNCSAFSSNWNASCIIWPASLVEDPDCVHPYGIVVGAIC